jgi:hypothetical protein
MAANARTAFLGAGGLVLAALPGLSINLGPGSSLQGNMPSDVFWLLSVELQGPQHMLPHLWRFPQWLSWGCYLVLAALALIGRHGWPRVDRVERISDVKPSSRPWPPARLRLTVVLAVIVLGLGVAWYAIEARHLVRVTVFQPFRMATMARGFALVFIAGRLVALWRPGEWLRRLRAILIAVAFTGDWLLVVVTLGEVAASAAEALRARSPWFATWRSIDSLVLFVMLALGLNFLGHHDTEYGHVPLLAALGVGVLIEFLRHQRKHVAAARNIRERLVFFPPLRKGGKENASAVRSSYSAHKLRVSQNPLSSPITINLSIAQVLALAWLVPLASLLAAAVPLDHAASRHPLVQGLINRCRFAAVPADDVERLALWCRDHTPATARFIGPPGPKTFRLWSRRSLAFNRAASPYHADGLADWFARFEDHVDFHGSPAEFVRSYVGNRHGFESRYQAQSHADRAALAVRQGATYVVAAAPSVRDLNAYSQPSTGPLDLLHVEGHYAVYRVRPELLVQRQR